MLLDKGHALFDAGQRADLDVLQQNFAALGDDNVRADGSGGCLLDAQPGLRLVVGVAQQRVRQLFLVLPVGLTLGLISALEVNAG